MNGISILRSIWLRFLPALLFVAGCGSSTGPEDESPCRQTREFGNFGCARIVAILEVVPEPWPSSRRWSVKTRAVDTSLQLGSLGPDPVDGVVPLELTLYMTPLPYGGDTASVWVTGKLLEDPRPIVVGVPLPVFASDSVFHVARFAEVGEVPVVDTVFLTLVAPASGPGPGAVSPLDLGGTLESPG